MIVGEMDVVPPMEAGEGSRTPDTRGPKPRALSTELHPQTVHCMGYPDLLESGRRGLNSRPSRWQRDALAN